MEPLVVVGSMATRHALAELGGIYRGRTGRDVTMRAAGGVTVAEEVRAGARADVVVLAAGAMDGLEAAGHLLAGSIRPFVRSLMALATPAGAPAPAIGSGEAVREAFRKLRVVGYSTGPSGDYLGKLWRGWGLDDDPGCKLVQAPAGVPVARLIAEGEVAIGLQQLSELLGQPGVSVIGLLPPDIQKATDFVSGIARQSHDAEAARAFCSFLAAPEHAERLGAQGFAV